MTVGEDKQKVSNIVRPNMHHFKSLYETVLEAEPQLTWKRSDQSLEQATDPKTRC